MDVPTIWVVFAVVLGSFALAISLRAANESRQVKFDMELYHPKMRLHVHGDNDRGPWMSIDDEHGCCFTVDLKTLSDLIKCCDKCGKPKAGFTK